MRLFVHCSRKIIKSGKSFFPVALFFLSTQLLFSNDTYGQRTKIDSMKRALPALHDSALVDCLNVLALAYTYLQTDSAEFYGQKAYSGSLSIHYLEEAIDGPE